MRKAQNLVRCGLKVAFGCLVFVPQLAAQARAPKDLFRDPPAQYSERHVVVKLKEKPEESVLIPYSQRRAAQDALLTRIKGKYGLSGEAPLFEALHKEHAKQNLSAAQHSRLLERQRGGETHIGPIEDLLSFYLLEIEEGQEIENVVKELQKDLDVEFAQPDYVHTLNLVPNDFYSNLAPPSSDSYWFPQLNYLWGAQKIRSAEANDSSLGEGVIIGLVDSGVDYNHEDLRENIWANPSEIPGDGADNDGNGYPDDVRGYDFVNNDSDPLDDSYHGTHLAGVMAAVVNNALGIYGTAPRAKIMALKAADADGTILSSRAAVAMQYAVAKGAKVINNSWSRSTPTPSDPTIEAAVRYAYNNGSTVIFAAGNNGADVAGYSPQNMAEPVVVGMTDNYDKRRGGSNYGSSVDVSAPGTDILSALNSTLTGKSFHRSLEGKYVRFQSGTSIAAAYVSGLAALMKAKNKDLTPAQIEQALKSGGVSLAQDPGMPVGNRIDALGTLTNYVPAVDHAAITQVSFANDQLSVSAVLRRASPVSCQLSWKRSSASTFTNLAGVTPAATGQEFVAGTINAASIKEAVINLRLACGTLTHDLSFYLDRLLDPAFFDKSGQRVNLLGNDTYDFKVARLSGTTWSLRQLQFQKVGASVWQSDGVSVQTASQPELANATLFTFDASALSPTGPGQYRFRLTATASGGGTPYTVTRDLLIQADPSPARGWPAYALGYVGEQQPAVADLDGDGKREICLDIPYWGGGGVPGLQVLNEDGSQSGLTRKYGEFVTGHYSIGLAAADLDGVPGREILMPLDYRLHAFKAGGASFTDLTDWPLQRANWWETWSGAPPPLVADLNFDGASEIVTLHRIDYSQYFLSVYSPAGVKSFEIILPQNMFQIDSLAVIDLDNDLQKEILVTTQTSDADDPFLRAYRLSGAEYAAPGWPVNLKTPSLRTGSLSEYSALAIATGDVEGDGDDEIVFTNQLHELFVLEKNGAAKSGFPRQLASTDGFSPAMIALGNLDSTPGAEIVVPNRDNLYVFNASGGQLPGWPKTLSGAVGAGYLAYAIDAPIIADINNDGLQEIMAVGSVANFSPYRPEQYLIAWNSAGTKVAQWNIHGGSSFPHNTGPAVADIDNDGTLELIQVGRTQGAPAAGGMVVGGEDLVSRVFVFELPGSSTYSAMDWPVFKANGRRTSQYIKYGDVSNDGQVSADDASRAAQAAVGLTAFKSEEREKGDVSGNGQLSAFDAALIARKAAGLVDRFGVEE